MKKFIPSIIAVFLVVCFAALRFGLSLPQSDYNLRLFASIPVSLDGRILPWDSVARDALQRISGNSSFDWSDSEDQSAIAWLFEILIDPEKAATRRIFIVTNPQIQSNLKRRPLPTEDQSKFSLKRFVDLGPDALYYSYDELSPYLERIEIQATDALEQSPEARNEFQKDIIRLQDSVSTFQLLGSSLSTGTRSPLERIESLETIVAKGTQALEAREAGQPFEERDYEEMMTTWYEFQDWEQTARISPLLHETDSGKIEWAKLGSALDLLIQRNEQNEMALLYAQLVEAGRTGEIEGFNDAAKKILSGIDSLDRQAGKKAGYEHFFNSLQPFSIAFVSYAIALLVAIIHWIRPTAWLEQSSLALMAASLAIHALGSFLWLSIIGETVIFNLHSSAILMSLFAVVVCLAFEIARRSGIYYTAASLAALVALFVVQFQSLHGNAFMRESWAEGATLLIKLHHLGANLCFALMFTIGSISIIWIFRAMLTDILDTISVTQTTKTINELTLAALLVGFGGIVFESLHSNFEYGVFWGWDKRENGLLAATAWCLIVTQCRWGNYLGPRSGMMLAICGNLIAAWAFIGWGIGKLDSTQSHSGFVSLLLFQGFLALNLIVLLLPIVPLRFWRSGNAIELEELE